MKVVLAIMLLAACSDDPAAPKDDYSIYKCRDAVTSGLPSGAHTPADTVFGTVFLDPSGTTPAAGANVTIRDGNLKIINIVTAANGNFASTEAIQFPFRVWVSSCPDVELMPDFVDTNTNSGASCAAGACHNNTAGNGVITLTQ